MANIAKNTNLSVFSLAVVLVIMSAVEGNRQMAHSSRMAVPVQPQTSRSSSYYYRYSSNDGGGSYVNAKCQRHRQDELRKGVVGNFVPRCDQEGHYSLMQCHGSTGHCWCVDRLTGVELPSTRTGPGRDRPDCRQVIPVHRVTVGDTTTTVIGGSGPGQGGYYEEYDVDYRNHYRNRPCDEDRNRPRAAVSGLYIPQCDADGRYSQMQCHPSKGECWCVERGTNRERAGSRRASARITPNMCATAGTLTGRDETRSTHGGHVRVTDDDDDSRVGIRVTTVSTEQVLAKMMELKRELSDIKNMIQENARKLSYIELNVDEC